MSDVSHPVLDRTRRLVFAHRGGSALGPENTLAAFDHGLACGADGFELDVHLAADGVPVVIHDAVLDRTTDASGPVGERTSAELAAVASVLGKLPTVAEYMEYAKRIDSMSKDVYRYLNFDKMPVYQEPASKVRLPTVA